VVLTEESFDFIISAKGRPTLVILPRDEAPSSPFIVYDRGSRLALFRSRYDIVELQKVPIEVRRRFLIVESIDVVEMYENGTVVRQYTANVVLDGMLKSKLKQERKATLGG